MTVPQPTVGDWYRLKSTGDLFEVVAFDADDGTVDVQYFDGTVEEMDMEDWHSQWDEGLLETAEAPEDWSGSVDVEPEEDGPRSESYNGESGDSLRASGLDALDLFE